MLAPVVVAMLLFLLPSATYSLPVHKQDKRTPVSAGLIPNVSRPGLIYQAKLVLANTRKIGSPIWGLTAAEADLACKAIAEAENFKRIKSNQLVELLWHPVLGKLLNATETKPSIEVEEVQGHLLSVGSRLELDAVLRALGNRKWGVYWTGARLVRRPYGNSMRGLSQPRADLSWTDGRAGSLEVLGLSTEDMPPLNPSGEYCLALDLRLGRWQARCCNDQLAYACTIRSLPKVAEDYPSEGESNKWRDHDVDIIGQPLISTEGYHSHATQQPLADSKTLTVVSTPVPANTTTQTPLVETDTVQTTSAASTEVTGLTGRSAPLPTAQTSTEVSGPTFIAANVPATETIPETTISASMPVEETELQEANLILTTVIAQPTASESTPSLTDSETTISTVHQLLPVRGFDEMATTPVWSELNTSGSNTEISHRATSSKSPALSPLANPMTSRPTTDVSFPTTGNEATTTVTTPHSSTVSTTGTVSIRPIASYGVSVSTEHSQASTLSVTAAAGSLATTTGTAPHSSTVSPAGTAPILPIESSGVSVSTEHFEASTLSVTGAALIFEGAAEHLPTTPTAAASPDTKKTTIGTHAHSSSATRTKSAVEYSTPNETSTHNFELTTSNQPTTSTQIIVTNLSTTVEKGLITSLSSASHGFRSINIAPCTPSPPATSAHTTVSHGTGQPATVTAGSWEGGDKTKEVLPDMLTTIRFSINSALTESSNLNHKAPAKFKEQVEGANLSPDSMSPGTSVDDQTSNSLTSKQPGAQTSSTLRSVYTSIPETTAHPAQTLVTSKTLTEPTSLSKNKVTASLAGTFEPGAPSIGSLNSLPTVARDLNAPYVSPAGNHV